MNSKADNENATLGRVGSGAWLADLERRVKYYEQMHADALRALDTAVNMSGEMKEQLVAARQQLERAKSANNVDMPSGSK